MKEWRRNIPIFLTALVTTFAGIFPATGCTGGCGSCFQCAGFGSVSAILIAIGVAGRKKQNEKEGNAVKINY